MLKSWHILEDLARRSGGTFKAEDVAKANVHPRDLYALRDAGSLVEFSRGVFRLANAGMSPYLDLVAVSRRSPRGAVCLNSALSFWDLTDEVPAEVHLAVPRGSHRPEIYYPPIRVHVFAADTFDLGREKVPLESGEDISIYSPDRSVVDAMRLRNRVGTDVAYETLCETLPPASWRISGQPAAASETAEGWGTRRGRSAGAHGLSESPISRKVYLTLQRQARNERRGTQELFEFYLLERFLYRLSVSQYRNRFVLKGGLLLTVLGVRRPTRDADVLARNIAGDDETKT